MFINSVLKIIRMVGYKQLSKQKRFWLEVYVQTDPMKRSVALQWRVVYGAVAADRHLTHTDQRVEGNCVFFFFFNLRRTCNICGLNVLVSLFKLLEEWLAGYGQVPDNTMFICGPKYRSAQRKQICLSNFLISQAKMGIWLTRRNKMKGTGSTDVDLIFKVWCLHISR